MAICRWSNHRCDLYIYESEFGIECNVAAFRYVDKPKQPPVQLFKDDPAKFRRANAEYIRALEIARIPIGLKYDGTSRTFDEWDELLEFVTELKTVGYQVPDRVLDEIRAISEEMAEEEET